MERVSNAELRRMLNELEQALPLWLLDKAWTPIEIIHLRCCIFDLIDFLDRESKIQ